VFEKLYKRSSFTASDLPSFRRQETVFILLSIGLLAVLLLAHTTFSYWGRPSRGLILLLGAVLLIDVFELVWVRGLTTELSPRTLTLLTWGSIALNLAAAGFLTVLVDHEDSPYYVVAVVPVLVAVGGVEPREEPFPRLGRRLRAGDRRSRLLLETLQAFLVCRQIRRQDFDRHFAGEPRVSRPVDFPHPARAERRENLVRSKARPGCQGQGGQEITSAVILTSP